MAGRARPRVDTARGESQGTGTARNGAAQGERVPRCFARLSYSAAPSSSRTRRLTKAGSAFPFMARMVWPTRKPMAFSLPFL